MTNKRAFRRSPRDWPDLPDKDFAVELPAIPVLPAVESLRLPQILQIAVPSTVTLLSVLVQILNPLGTNFSSPWSWVLTGAMGIYPIFTLFEFLQRKRESDTQRQRTLDAFRRQMEVCEQMLSNIATRQNQVLSQTNPKPDECVLMPRRLDPHLWGRDPQDLDFLSVRVGVGKVPILASIKSVNNSSSPDDALAQESVSLMRRFRTVEGPVTIPLSQWGATGILAKGEDRHKFVRSLVVNLATHHSPDEVKIVALYPYAEGNQWEWISQLPHAKFEGSPVECVVNDKDRAKALLSKLRELIEMQAKDLEARQADFLGTRLPSVRFVVLLADPKLYEEDTNLIYLLTEGLRLGAIPLVFATGVVPRQCRGRVEIDKGGGYLRPGQVRDDSPEIAFDPDTLSLDQVRGFASEMSTIELQLANRPEPIPDRIGFMQMLGVESVEAMDVPGRWQTKIYEQGAFPAPIGMMAGRHLMNFNLHDGDGKDFHGAHILIAGTTGYGKSYLLQALILSIGVQYHPNQVSFFLIDFKGGALAQHFQKMPHLCGSVTDLDKGEPGMASSLLHRTVTALRSEIERRERDFASAKVDYIDKYQKVQPNIEGLKPIPRLIIIVDEFAELKQQHPDFLDELIKTARKGRSLGVHLILATQQPAGIVDDQVLTNIRSVLCLKMRSPNDSALMLDGRPDAAYIQRRGYGYLLVAGGERFDAFQAAIADGNYLGDVGAEKRTELAATIDHLHDTAQALSIDPLPALTLPPLPDPRNPKFSETDWPEKRVTWDATQWQSERGGLTASIGLQDDPHNRKQGALDINLADWGNLVIFGRAGSGKTTMVQTLLAHLLMTHSPAEMQLYVLDFNSQDLKSFERMPHVGNVILEDEKEHVERLLGYLNFEIARRRKIMRDAGSGAGFAGYREMVARKSNQQYESLPAIVLAIDGFTTFVNSYEDFVDPVVTLAAEGSSVGIHIVITANSPSNIPMRLQNNVRLVATLELADDDYYSAIGPTDHLKPASVIGRGLIKRTSPLLPLEFQVQPALLMLNNAERLNRLREIGDAMRKEWAGEGKVMPRLINVLNPRLTLSEVMELNVECALAVTTRAVPIGIAVNDLTLFALDLASGPHFLVVGEPLTGKTTCLMTLVRSVDHYFPDAILYLSDFSQNDEGLIALRHLATVHDQFAEKPDALQDFVGEIDQIVQERREMLDSARQKAGDAFNPVEFVKGLPVVMLILDDLPSLDKKTESLPELEESLIALIQGSRGLGIHIVLAGTDGDIYSTSAPGYVDAISQVRAGIVLGATDSDALTFRVREPNPDMSEGFFVRRSKPVRIKVAMSGSDFG